MLLVTFVRDLTRYAERGREEDARRALCSPYSGVPSVDARAVCALAGERHTLAETIAREGIAPKHDVTLALRRFVRALDEVRAAYRAQGSSAGEHFATIRLAFDFDACLDAGERATMARLDELAADVDALREPGEPWDPATLLRSIEAFARTDAWDAIGAAARAPARKPLTAYAPEASRAVAARRGHFSASSLGTFAECERRWYYRYVCAAVEDRGSSASFYGTAFHWALERFHQEFPRASDAPLEVLERKLEAYLGTSFERFRSGFGTSVEFELQRRRAKRTARRYLAWFVERARAHPFEVIGTEVAVELALEGYAFVGYIDRVDRDDATGAVTLVDYKTGNIAQSAAEYRSKVARFLDFQLPFYYWARTAAGDRVTRLSLVPLREATRDVQPVELEIVPVALPRSYSDEPVGTIGIDELERARVKMIEIARLLADGPVERFPVTGDAEVCTFCAYAGACRSRPLQSEDRFGR
jgi:hypothetical protein